MTLTVPLNDLAAHHAPFAEEIARTVARVVESSRFILGEEVAEFEAASAAFLGVRHAVGVSSGTDALVVALTALGVGPGASVVTTPFTFFATVEAILRVGARPRFVDVDATSLQIDVERVAEAIDDSTRAIVPVHLYGSMAPLDELAGLAAKRGVPLVEDAAQAFGSRHLGRCAGSWGALGCFSFFPAKSLGALGDGGLIVTNDDALAARCRRLRQHGRDGPSHVELGGNYRLDALQAALLKMKLGHVARFIAERRAHADAYDTAFAAESALQNVARGPGWNGAIYTRRVAEGRRDALRAHLRACGIETAVYYERPAHHEPLVAKDVTGRFEESERAAKEVLSLPLYPEMSEEQRDHVISATTQFFR